MTLHSSRPDARTDLLHGTLDMLILRPSSGARSTATPLARRSRAVVRRAPGGSGSLYPALQRLAKGWVTAKWGQTEANSAPSSIGSRPKARSSSARGIAMDRARERDRPRDETAGAPGTEE